MYSPPVSNPSLQRSFQMLYGFTQATPWSCVLDPDWDYSFDILPGTVMASKGGDVVTPFTGATGQRPIGFSEFWVAPTMGVDEVTPTGTNNFAVWILNQDAEANVFAPAFDPNATWTAPSGTPVFLTATSHGLLTPVGGSPTFTQVIAELWAVPATNQITIKGLSVPVH